MDALMPALVAALGCLAADRPAWLAAILADRFGPWRVLVGAALALAVASGIAVTGGILAGPLFTPEIKALFLSLALVLQGVGLLARLKEPDRLAGWRLPGLVVAPLGLFILFFGDGLQLIVAALAARSTLPWAAMAGAVVGGTAALVPAAILGEAAWRAWPLVLLRRVAAAGFLVVGLWIAASGFGLL